MRLKDKLCLAVLGAHSDNRLADRGVQREQGRRVMEVVTRPCVAPQRLAQSKPHPWLLPVFIHPCIYYAATSAARGCSGHSISIKAQNGLDIPAFMDFIFQQREDR